MSGVLGELIGAVRRFGVRYAYYRGADRKLSAQHGDAQMEHIVTGDCSDIINMRASVEPDPPMRQAERIRVQHGKSGHRSE